ECEEAVLADRDLTRVGPVELGGQRDAGALADPHAPDRPVIEPNRLDEAAMYGIADPGGERIRHLAPLLLMACEVRNPTKLLHSNIGHAPLKRKKAESVSRSANLAWRRGHPQMGRRTVMPCLAFLSGSFTPNRGA